jgi:multicomponent Na+:H+ antiporter subunit E
MPKPAIAEMKLRDTGVLFLTLMLFWVLLVNNLALETLFVGAIISATVALLYRDGLSFFTEFRFTPQALVAGFRYYAYFFQQLVKSNLRLARIVSTPELPIDPGIVKIRTGLQSRMGRLMLANSITLTPGTLTVEVSGEWLYVHCVTLGDTDVEAATRDIAAGFERYLEVMYG